MCLKGPTAGCPLCLFPDYMHIFLIATSVHALLLALQAKHLAMYGELTRRDGWVYPLRRNMGACQGS